MPGEFRSSPWWLRSPFPRFEKDRSYRYYSLPGAKIIAFLRDDVNKVYTLKYEFGGKTYSVRYTLHADDTITFVYTDGHGRERTEINRRQKRN
jgi:hypothetical protein